VKMTMRDSRSCIERGPKGRGGGRCGHWKSEKLVKNSALAGSRKENVAIIYMEGKESARGRSRRETFNKMKASKTWTSKEENCRGPRGGGAKCFRQRGGTFFFKH